jgi:site-specific DNA-methyltransferase (adenine-specific)
VNELYYGDNLEVLRRYVKDESVDLVYLDPPFNSNQDYNVLFAEHDGTKSQAQIKAFGDTWHWDEGAARAYQETVERGADVAKVMQAFRTFLGDNDMLAYLAMMAPRLMELHRVLAPTGSLYLHCDPTASHYLKMLLDSVFTVGNYHNEITWRRTSAHANVGKRYAVVQDRMLFYSKSEEWTWNQLYIPYSAGYIESHYSQREPDGRRFTTRDLTASMQRASSGQLYEWKGVRPPSSRCWACGKEGMEQFEAKGLLTYSPRGMPRLKLYLDEMPGVPCDDMWVDIPPINSQAQERLGYPTQKPEPLLERIITTSSNAGDLVLDPFCGCGTAIAVSERLKRRWIGIDITHLAITLIKHRLKDAFGDDAKYTVIGEPVSLSDAQVLAQSDPYQFQWWALGLVGARPVEGKKGADKGIDGRLYFHDEPKATKQMIFSVKAGALHATYVRDLRGVVEREQAQIGVLISMEKPTQPMRSEAASAGFYQAPSLKRYPRLQLLTIADLLAGKGIDYPSEQERKDATFKKAPRAKDEQPENQKLF